MLKIMTLIVLISLVIMFVAYFFGRKTDEKKVARTYFVGVAIGVSCMVGAFFTDHLFVEKFQVLFSGVCLFIFGLLITGFSPLFASLIGVASSEPFKGPYQKMDAEQKKNFWDAVRSASKIGARMFSQHARRNGNHDAANAARWASKII